MRDAKLKIVFLLLFLLQSPALLGQTDLKTLEQIEKDPRIFSSHQSSISALSEEIEAHPDDALLYLRRAKYHGYLDQKLSAMEDVRKALSLKPDDLNVVEAVGRALYFADLCEDGVVLGNSLIARGNDLSFFGYRIRYLNRFCLHDYAGAIHDMLTNGDVYGDADQGPTPLLPANKDGEIIRFESVLSQTLDHLRDDPNITAYYDKLFHILEERRNGPTTMGSSMALRRAEIRILESYAKYFEEKKSPREAAQFYERLAADRGLQTRAEIYSGLSRFELAIDDLTELIRTSNRDRLPYYLIVRGDNFVQQCKIDKAIADYEKAAESGGNPQITNERVIDARNKKGCSR